ncbi:TetR family transcriptional regulator [Mycolicibacterium wolinskyi]|uniref:TetR family transcriptional regulator n=1 Tax=Mycolicibacterium wolinskyi TaxID=59750 RepID=A0A132PU28_9MYCO|nr:TetR/AcrR family transcriptional regulator [Mycolicibacterium wolinskyi]KWX25849.1 TetR family transcriptional regulator [Mycolicibacterium wolinskyi]
MFEKPPSRQAAARTTVVQRRGIARMETILATAESLLAEQGYAAATLKGVGERAGIPTASLYHYFTDRRQLDAELGRRHVRALDERFAEALSHPRVQTLRDAVDAMIDPLFTYCREHPGMVQLWFVGRSSILRELADGFDEAWAEQLWRFLVARSLIRPGTPLLVVQLVFEVGDQIFDIAFRRSPTGDDATIDEGCRVLTAYLETYAPSAAERDTSN